MLQIDTFDKEHLPEEATTWWIIKLFQENYPAIYPEEIKQNDLLRYKYHWQIIDQIEEWNSWIVWKIDDDVVWFLKFRNEDRWLYADSTLSNLVSWIMFSNKLDITKTWIRREVVEKYFCVLRELKTKTKKRVISIADVHEDNKISLNMCKKVWFNINPNFKKTSFLLLEKEI